MYAQCQKDGVAFNLTSIPNDFTMKAKSEFDTAYMKAIYERGYQMGQTPAEGRQTRAGQTTQQEHAAVEHTLPLVHLRKEDGGFTHDRSP